MRRIIRVTAPLIVAIAKLRTTVARDEMYMILSPKIELTC
jgi:hypothetical protein